MYTVSFVSAIGTLAFVAGGSAVGGLVCGLLAATCSSKSGGFITSADINGYLGLIFGAGAGAVIGAIVANQLLF